MKILKFVLGMCCILWTSSFYAQENKITEETAEKTYKIISNDKVIKNSVKVNTQISQEIEFAEEDEDKIDAKREFPPKKITKTVLIDNDEDDAFDEKIVFNYMSTYNSDFTLVTNGDDLVVGIDDGDNLNILESEKISKTDLKDIKEAYVFTNNNGEKVEFFIESYESLNEQ